MSSWLQTRIDVQPNDPALYWQDTCWSFAEVGSEVKRWCQYYQAETVYREKRVALLSSNSPEMYFSILSLWELGKEIVFLNTHLQVEELYYQLKNAQVTTVIVAKEFLSYVQPLKQKGIHLVLLTCLERTTQLIQKTAPHSVASIMYTSGTTGYPKGVPQKFSNYLASALATQKNMNVTSKDCWLCSLPLFHISGLSIITRQLIVGCSIRLYAKFDSQRITDDLVRGRSTLLSVVAVTLQKLMDDYPKQGYHHQFRMMLLGGGPVNQQLLLNCQKHGIAILQSYGMTETCSQIIALNAADAIKKLGSAGLPLQGVEIKIVNKKGESIPAKQVGEILVRGKMIVSSYLNKQDEKWTVDRWFHTSDMGYLDEEGYLYLVSRLNELIISGGENIYPAEVENILQNIPLIEEVAVVGEEDTQWGAVPVAYIVSEQNITLEEIQHFASKYLAKYKLPTKLYLCTHLPRTVNGKIAKQYLTTEEREAFLCK